MGSLWQPRVIEGGKKDDGGASREGRAALLESIRAEWEKGGRIYGEAMAGGLRTRKGGDRENCLPLALAACSWLEVSDVYSVALSTLSPEKLGRMGEGLKAALRFIGKIGGADRKAAVLLYNRYAGQFRSLFEDAGLDAPPRITCGKDVREKMRRYWLHVKLNGELAIEEDALARGGKTALPTITEWHREERRRAWKKDE